MKKLWILAGALALVLIVGSIAYRELMKQSEIAPPDLPLETSQEEEKPKIPAPDFIAWDENGEEVQFSQLLGEVPVVVNFWTSWCGPCRMEMPEFNRAAAAYGDRLRFLMLNMTGDSGETRAKAEEYIAEEGFTFPVWYDEARQGAYAYGVGAFPTTVLIDGEGNLAAWWAGPVTEEVLHQRIEEILGVVLEE